MVREFFMTCHMVCDLLIDELIFACHVNVSVELA